MRRARWWRRGRARVDDVYVWGAVCERPKGPQPRPVMKQNWASAIVPGQCFARGKFSRIAS